MGNTLRRLLGKFLVEDVSMELPAIFSNKQIGVGVSNAGTSAAHAVQAYLADCQQSQADTCILHLDLSNAFNAVDRLVVLQEVDRLLPSLGP
ncbi:MAG: hypothetical protein AAF329_25900 [Cyanobacteria bacterium P01_A01_bin.17]